MNLKSRLEIYLPSLFEFIEGDFAWTSVNKSFDKYYQTNKEIYDKGKHFKINLYTTVIDVINGNMYAIAFFSHLDNTLKKLSKSLNSNEKEQVKKILYGVLLAEHFLDHLAELYVLDNLLDTKIYKLIEIGAVKGERKKEYKKAADIDIKLKIIDTGEDVFVEVVSLILDEYTINNKEIKKWLLGKLKKKIADKNETGIDYTLVPVIWSEKVESLKKIQQLYKENNFKIDNAEDPRVFSWFKDLTTRFGSIHSVLEPIILKEKNFII